MTVFELQIDPERNAVIRRALAKRIVHQRELEEEEASTEEDESFLLGSPIAIARKGASPSPSPSIGSQSSRKEQHRLQNLHLQSNHRPAINNARHLHTPQPKQHIGRQRSTSESGGCVGLASSPTISDNGSFLNIKSRWKTQYLRATTASPSGSVISVISTMSEILPEMSSVTLPEILLNNVKELDTASSSLTDANMASPPPPSSTAAAASVATVIVTVNADTLETAASESVQAPDTKVESSIAPREESTSTSTSAAVKEGPDLVEQDLLMELEELRKEKSRLFSLFRAALQKKEETPPLPPPTQPSQSVEVTPISTLNSGSTLPSVAEEESQQEEETVATKATSPSFKAMDSLRETNDVYSADRNGGFSSSSNMKDDSRRKPMNPRRPSDQDYDRRTGSPSRPNFKRREHETIDRSKLNLEIPRKPSVPSSASASSNSTASTPTPTSAAFSLHHHHPYPYQVPPFPSSSSTPPFSQKGKRQRSVSPSIPYGPGPGRLGGGGGPGEKPGGDGGRGSSAGSFGSMYSDSAPPNKHPRADYNMGSHGRNQNSGGNSSINGGSHHSFNGLPEKPQIRHHHNHHHNSHGGGDDGYQRGKHGGPTSSSFSNMNGSINNNSSNNYINHNNNSSNSGGGGGGSGGGGGNNGNYRQGGPIRYPPPTRIGFGNSNGNSNGGHNNNSSNNNNNSNNGNNSGPGNSSGRNGYYGHGDGGGGGNNNGGGAISKFGPPNRPLPFRNMMQMNHARGMAQNRNGFGGGGGGGGGGRAGGPPDRPMSSGRVGDWNRRRSRA